MFDLQGYGHLLLQGAWLTGKLTLISWCVGMLFGLAGVACKMSKFAILRTLATAYTTITRGLPELLVVFFVFLGGDMAFKAIARAVGYTQYVEISSFWAGVLALSVMFGAYATEVFKMALAKIPKGQWEAGQSLGMRPAPLFFRIILPQMWAVALPALGNLTLVLLKDTALVSLIALKELMFFAGRAAQSTQRPFTFYLAAALIYLGFTLIIYGILWQAKRAANPAARYAKKLAISQADQQV